jgi:hypothetical protein
MLSEDAAYADTPVGALGPVVAPGPYSSDSPGWRLIKKPSHPVHTSDIANRTAPASAVFNAILLLSLFTLTCIFIVSSPS